MPKDSYTYETEKPGIVFIISTIFVLAFVIWGFVRPNQLAEVASQSLNFTIENFGWFYMIIAAFFVSFIIFLAVSPYGKLRLGQPEDRPEYSFYSWLGMLFSAGIGVGFVFWGVAEPVLYYLDTPLGRDLETQAEAAQLGLNYSIFHWAFHPWAIFSLVALALGYVQFRKGQPALISSAFYPLFGDRVRGKLGQGIDILAVLATSTGVATTFGLSAMQISGGLSYLTGIPNTAATQLIIIAIVSVLFMISAASGLDKGIRYLSIINLTVAGLLLLFTIFLGPTIYLLETFTTSLGAYIANFVPMSLTMTPFTESSWLGTNTIFYWAWHISWAPFMGMFIARISRGRTIREFIGGVLLVPSLLAVIWFSVFGGSALGLEMNGVAPVADIVTETVELALFVTLQEFPLSGLTNGLAIILILIFFITSADSASYTLGAMTSRGSLDPTLFTKITWGILIAGTASVLLLSNGLEGLQTASIVAALPFSIIMAIMIISMLKMFTQDLRKERRQRRNKQMNEMKEEILTQLEEEIDDFNRDSVSDTEDEKKDRY
ncbi:BCCT family transporter [Alteribacillus iranensis]|uniref:Glycine betaine transporter n=1 Tax=Alteribacillus iranensis TaxID=930128 RepID=A0A1I2CTQ8_9BACI|nr:BCCT family transporter [Alteribacillus iranensis]SFE71727.1 glycine betaine transporter [Alteribacillus iranensis]